MALAPRPWLRRGHTAVVAVSALGLVLAAPAAADPTEPGTSGTGATPTAPSSTTPSGTGTDPGGATPSTDDPWSYDGSGEDAGDAPLSTSAVDDQVAEAERLTDELLRDDKDIATAVADLKRQSRKANSLLQRYAKARDEYSAAKKEADTAERKLDRLKGRLDEGRKDLRDWAFDTYTQGGGYNDAMVLVDTLGRDREALGSSAGDISYLTDNRIRSVDLVREDTVTQASLTREKEKAEDKAAKAKKRAGDAKERLEGVVKDRKARLERLRKEHAEELKDAGPVVQALLGIDRQDAKDASSALKDAISDVGGDVTGLDEAAACSDNDEVYPNGQVPPGGLCPLYGADGESLRPQAAAAFDAMSKAYERDTGQPICVTDSYRSYAEQVLVKKQRGGWAAAPGKSNHGFGLALDLCGGINSFGHPSHLWMQQNAPLYGWFHPDWAAAGGSLPEPWHWEYAG